MSNQLLVNNKIENDKVLKAVPFKKIIRKTTAHKHNNYFEIIYLSQGSGFHFIDLKRYEIKPPVMFFVRQDQVHYWEIDSEPDVYVVILRKSFVEKSLDKELKSLIEQISSQCCLQLKDNSTIETLLELLTAENKISAECSFHVTEGLLKSILAKIIQVSKPIINKAETKSDLYHSFIQLVNTDAVVVN